VEHASSHRVTHPCVPKRDTGHEQKEDSLQLGDGKRGKIELGGGSGQRSTGPYPTLDIGVNGKVSGEAREVREDWVEPRERGEVSGLLEKLS